jgi:hypothetical protein
LDGDDPDTVERMLSYLYTLDYDDGSSRRAGAASCSEEPGTKNPEEDETKSVLTPPSTQEVNRLASETAEASPESPEQIGMSAAAGIPEDNSVVEESGLLNNILVYAIADKYGIFELKELAKTKFLAEADSLMSTDEFPEIIKMVYVLPDGDRALRNAVLKTCVKQVRALMGNVAPINTVKSIGDFGFDILGETLKHNDERLKQILAQKAVLKDEVAKARAEKLNDVKQVTQALLNTITAVNRYEACKNCGAGFCGRLDADDLTKLRCAKCSTKHRCF